MSLEHPLRFRRAALGGLMVTALLFLSGCSAEQEGEIKRLAMPIAATKEAPYVHDLWMWSWLAAMVTGVIVWGLIVVRLDPLPPPQRVRDPDPDALQPADRDLLHDRPDHDGDRLLLLHPGHPEEGPARRPEPRRDHHGRRSAVVVDLQLQPRLRHEDQQVRAGRRQGRRLRGRHHRRTPDAVAGQGQERHHQPGTRPTSSTRSGCPAFLFKMDVVPGRAQPLHDHPDASGHVRGQVRRALRRLPLADALQRQGRRPGGVRRPPRGARRAGQHRPGTGRLGGRHDPRLELRRQHWRESDRRLRRARWRTRRRRPSTRWGSRWCASSPPPTTS